MAVKWAVEYGSWDTGATWNDGVVPTSADIVYLNGKRITITNGLSINCLELRNDTNPNTSMTGGSLTHSLSGATTLIIKATLYIGSSSLLSVGSHYQGRTSLYVIGNIYSTNETLLTTTAFSFGDSSSGSYSNILSITGNCNIICLLSTGSLSKNGQSWVINGNATVRDGNTITSCTANGTLTNSLSKTITTFNLVGNLICKDNAILDSTNATINGTICYENNNNQNGVRFANFNILNPDTFTWKDITEPRSNPFIILTDADMNNRQQYPAESDVKKDVEYAWGALVGTMESGVQVGCVTKEDVREGVPLLGMGEVGTLVVPSVDDVREGVVFDNGSVGTLIVQGGGDRLRIADFGYYTNAQSDTYIVDLTEQDKPKFAVAEERVLIEMFPDLDLDNIPEKYFDDLFVKYLKYRLIVEYYRTAGINSTFTPSEPTTEIVNYRNVNCEIWMNIANTYLKAWGEKYPNSIKKQRILL